MNQSAFIVEVYLTIATLTLCLSYIKVSSKLGFINSGTELMKLLYENIPDRTETILSICNESESYRKHEFSCQKQRATRGKSHDTTLVLSSLLFSI